MALLFTICTPTYNRAPLLARLYASLQKNISESIKIQWLLIDDGSKDSTEEIILSFEHTKGLDIKYIKKENHGKHSCLNYAFKEAKGELFLILDSDDLLLPDALTKIRDYWLPIRDDNKIAGIIGHCINYKNNKVLGDLFPTSPMYSTILRNNYKLNLKGDRADFIRTTLLHNKEYPVITGEKFMPEGYVTLDFDEQYLYFCVNDNFKVVEYQDTGISNNYSKLAMSNPYGTALALLRVINNKNLLSQVDSKAKVKFYGNYIRYCLHQKNSKITNILKAEIKYPVHYSIALIAGITLYAHDKLTLGNAKN